MTIYVNGKEDILAEAASIGELIKRHKVKSPDMVSVQLNGEILKSNAFHNTLVKNGDKVEFLYFMGGGA